MMKRMMSLIALSVLMTGMVRASEAGAKQAKASPSDFYYAWIDLEMTGLNPDTDKVVEIGTILTDKNLNVIAEGPNIVTGGEVTEDNIKKMPKVVQEMHEKSGLLAEIRKSKETAEGAAQRTVAFINEKAGNARVYLAGNTVHQDRAFIRNYMPTLFDRLHFRLVDVSTLKTLLQGWYPDNPKTQYQKPAEGAHRALDDARQSLEELRHYRKHFITAQ